MPHGHPSVLEKPASSPSDPTARGTDGLPDPTTSTRGVLGAGPTALPFTLERFAPAAPLSSHVERHWSTRWELPPGTAHVQEVLPHPCVNLVVHHGTVGIYGIPMHRDVRRLTDRGAAVGTKFRPGAFAGFSRVPMLALRGAALPLAEVFGADGAVLEGELRTIAGDGDPDAGAVARTIGAVERFLAARMPDDDPGFELVQAITRDMLRRAPEARVATIARDHGVSERTLQRIFRTYVGVGPKWVLRRYRLHTAAERLGAEGAGDLIGLAHELGYADQAHFANDFRAAIGMRPTEYAAVCGHR